MCTIEDAALQMINPGAPHTTSSGAEAGAIFIQDGTLVIHDSAFETNTAKYVSE
jgi:hypothetical protein